jgi:hypothetical protein
VDYDVRSCGVGREERGRVVVALDNRYAWIRCREIIGDATEEHGDAVFWMRGEEGVEDGAANVAC